MNYEYGISLRLHDLDDPHRVGMSKEDAEQWLRECDEMGFRSGVFTMIRRPVGEWEVCNEQPAD